MSYHAWSISKCDLGAITVVLIVMLAKVCYQWGTRLYRQVPIRSTSPYRDSPL